MLDVAIGTVFIFLLFSLVVTAANEIWLSLLDKRAAFLKEGLEELLRGSGAVSATALLNHGLISALSRGSYDANKKTPGFLKQLAIGLLPASLCKKGKLTTGTEGVPSYIPGKSFVLAVLSLIPKPTSNAGAGANANPSICLRAIRLTISPRSRASCAK